MRIIKAQPLTPEAFRKYGVYQDLLDDASTAAHNVNGASGFRPDLISMNFGATTQPTISVCRVEKKERNIVNFMEAHQYTCEGLIPLDGDVIIYVGVPGRGEFSVENLEAFIVPMGTFVKLNPLIVHGSQYPIDRDVVRLICMLPERTFRNDMIFTLAREEDKQAELVL